MLKILQLNVNRSRVAQTLLCANASQTQSDVLVVSEPNRNYTAGGSWKTDVNCDSAILLLNTRKAVSRQGVGQGYVWVELTDIRIFSCYFSPNKPLEEILQALDQLAEEIRSSAKGAIIAGDFNAKSLEWGEHREDERGRILADWAAALQLACLNEGTEPTFIRGNASSRLDVTFCTEGLERRRESWKVLETETLSDHQCIEFKLTFEQRREVEHSRRWWVDKNGYDRLKDSLHRKLGELVSPSLSSLTEVITGACRESLPLSGGSFGRRKPAYWWTSQIRELRKQCLKARRHLM